MPESAPVQLTNTLSRRVEPLEPISPGEIKLYTCGPTVYNFAHIGNFRSFLFADVLRRVLEYNGYKVHQVRNITDVGHLTNDELGTGIDKIEASARAQNMAPLDLASYYTDAFLADARRLNLLEPEQSPKATDYVPSMIQLIERLIAEGYAYESHGSVYFEVSKFPGYGRLSGNSVDDLIAGSRVEIEDGKRAPADFALWKAAGPDKLMRYPSPWGEGVPGWHVECSAMAMDLLGDEIDIHTGGEDHVFPHHEDEIAQSEAATGKPFARLWMHGAFLQLPKPETAGEGEKMSKSSGKVFLVQDMVDRGIHPLAYRYFTFEAHYRTPQTFSWEALEGAQNALRGMWEAVALLHQESAEVEEPGMAATEYQRQFLEAINRDLDVPGAVAVAHAVIRSKLPPGQKLALLYDFDRVLGLDLEIMARRLSEITPEQQGMIDERAKARAAKDFARSDALRDGLAQAGVEVRDTPMGQRWIRRDVFAQAAPVA
ncbi:MAG: cysteine--tRNA ligase [Chloroflexota bacterium]